MVVVVFCACSRTLHSYNQRNQGILEPGRYLTIAMDGTDQLSNGIPQFRESSKDDTGQMRIKNHLEVVQIAGAPDIIKCYVVPEDVANDSNVSVEVLQRTLKAEERRRGDLPPLLNVQLDNCRGANKNTYLFAYLAWLIEREVFSVVFVSFLPVATRTTVPTGSRAASPMQFAKPTFSLRGGSSRSSRVLTNPVPK